MDKKYLPMPVWAVSEAPTEDEITRQIERFAEMGCGGFMLRRDDGCTVPYLSDEHCRLLSLCLREAEKRGMTVAVADDDRFPSGTAGGLLTKDGKYVGWCAVLLPFDRWDDLPKDEAIGENRPYFLSAFSVKRTEDGVLHSYRVIERTASARDKWYAFAVPLDHVVQFNDTAYADLLRSFVTTAFCDLTMTKTNLPYTVFCEEPFRVAVGRLPAFSAGFPVTLPWTPDLPDTYRERFAEDLVAVLPEIVFGGVNGKPATVRYRFAVHLDERFESGFFIPYAEECKKRGLPFCFAPRGSDSLRAQIAYTGDVMRHYRHADLPAVKNICDMTALCAFKQAQSVMRQYGKEGVAACAFDVTNWDFGFKGYLAQGNRQASLGATRLFAFRAIATLHGENKRNYPASFNYQSPWYKEFDALASHFARVYETLSAGEAAVSVGVIHPVESAYLFEGPDDLCGKALAGIERRTDDLALWLCGHQLDFDFISEAVLSDDGAVEDKRLRVGKMAYSAIIVPACVTLRSSTERLLSLYRKNGGTLFFLGEVPTLIDGKSSEKGKWLAARSVCLPFEKESVLLALDQYRTVRLTDGSGAPVETVAVCRRRTDKEEFLLFAPLQSGDEPQPQTVTLAGEYGVWRCETETGTETPVFAAVQDGKTTFTLPEGGGSLYRLSAPAAVPPSVPAVKKTVPQTVPQTVPYRTEEQNVLLLDRARWKLDDGEWESEEEILRLDDRVRRQCGFVTRNSRKVQPWTRQKPSVRHTLTMEFSFTCRVKTPLFLAVERNEGQELFVNGEPLLSPPVGWYLDEKIDRFALPKLPIGKNSITVSLPFSPCSQPEALYLLGKFAARVQKTDVQIEQAPDKVAFSDLTGQGFFFYGGNFTYDIPVTVPKSGMLSVTLPAVAGALCALSLDGKRKARLLSPPYTAALPVTAGEHTLSVTVFGDRYNTLGALHNHHSRDRWYGPTYWRGTDGCFDAGYCPHEAGLLLPPVINWRENT